MPKPRPSQNSNRFFLTFHRYISTPTSPHPHRPPAPTTTRTRTRTAPPLPPPPLRHLRNPSPRHSSTTTTSPPPSAPPSHYALFPQTLPHGPPPTGPFTIDLRRLRHEYLQLQSRAHPDRHHQSGDKARAEGASATINEAYKTLQSPLLRAQYLLARRGVDVAGDEGARLLAEGEDGDGDSDGDGDGGLLMEVMEAREEIEGAAGEGELEGVRARNERRIGESEGVLGEAFGRDDVEGARREAVRLRYWINIKGALDGWEKGKPVVLVH